MPPRQSSEMLWSLCTRVRKLQDWWIRGDFVLESARSCSFEGISNQQVPIKCVIGCIEYPRSLMLNVLFLQEQLASIASGGV